MLNFFLTRLDIEYPASFLHNVIKFLINANIFNKVRGADRQKKQTNEHILIMI